MRKKLKWLIALCFTAILLLMAMQGFWLRKYYLLSTDTFKREANIIFEDALRKEFSLRADTIQEAIKNKLLDTAVFRIKSRYSEKHKKMVYTIQSKEKLTDTFRASFSLHSYDKSVGDDSTLTYVAIQLANMLRNEDLDNHIIYYRTQALGKFMSETIDKMRFDTTRLRPVLDAMLLKRDINVPYSFLGRKSDSTFYQANLPDSLLKIYPVITRSLPTYNSANPGQAYIRVMFRDPLFHILGNMYPALTAAVLLSLLMSGCLYILLSSLYKEKKISALKSDFISNMTHEFKTPLATASIAVDALLHDDEAPDKPAKTIRYLQHAKNNMEQLNLLTDKILKLALYEREEQIIRKEKINFMAIIREIAEAFQLNKENIRIHLEHRCETSFLEADETQFRHAVSNVIENAVKYGGGEVEITISCKKSTAKMLLIEVRDYGPGIPEAALPHIFDKFYRVPGQAVKGYGLGLHYVQQILKLHRGWYKALPENPGLTIQLAWPV